MHQHFLFLFCSLGLVSAEINFEPGTNLGEAASEVGETPGLRVSEFFTAYINTTYMVEDRGIIHTDRTEIGRFGSNGGASIAGFAVVVRSQAEDESLDDYACTLPLKFTPTESPLIAVIKRGICTFEEKVANAMSIGAVGVLIYDNLDEPKLKTVEIPAKSLPTVFTYLWKGLELVQLLEEGASVFLSMEVGSHCSVKGSSYQIYCTTNNWLDKTSVFNPINPFGVSKDNVPQNTAKTSVVFVSVSFLVLMFISISWLLFYYVQRFRFIRNKDELERRLGRQAKQALNCINLIIVEDPEAECSVCLEGLQVGQEARKLPCSHTFHRACIDNWLLTKRKCPLCKLNIVKHFGLTEWEDSEAGSEESQYSQGSHTYNTTVL